jgi:hypothetical protein
MRDRPVSRSLPTQDSITQKDADIHRYIGRHLNPGHWCWSGPRYSSLDCTATGSMKMWGESEFHTARLKCAGTSPWVIGGKINQVTEVEI